MLSKALLQKVSQSSGRQMSEFKVALVTANYESALALALELCGGFSDKPTSPRLEALWLRVVDLSQEVGGLLFELQSRDNNNTSALAESLVKSRQVILEEYSKIGAGIPASRKIAAHLGL